MKRSSIIVDNADDDDVYDNADENRSSIVLNKDVLGIIKEYARPQLWLYWVYDEHKDNDQVKNSNVIEADNIRDAYIKIYDDIIAMLVRTKIIRLPVTDILYIKKQENMITMNNQCCHEGCKCIVPPHRFCNDHFPSNEILLKYIVDSDHKYHTIWRLNYNIDFWRHGHYLLKIKQLKW